MTSIVAAMEGTKGAAVATIIVMAITATIMTVRAGRRATAASGGALTIVKMVSGMKITIAMWWQIGLAT